jgi:hypothetical protein
MLSILAQGANDRQPSRLGNTITSDDDDQDIEIDGLNDLRTANVQRYRSTRVSFHCQEKNYKETYHIT